MMNCFAVLSGILNIQYYIICAIIEHLKIEAHSSYKI